ncbi:DUF3761 domain-containing protein [Herbaspirillum sp.]|uniref:DUF3761 domain-containing protein n=1 Tax=Herbaspirillum sp. TaxID=1890675 RepID=UPI001B017D8C|nr:DUF3761 domain-containing protein [Herbaspirillum sp.]MBO9537000.1 DUF3761 domain-containing protein [Herbaspirillum sp.]
MNTTLKSLLAAAGFLIAASSFAQTPAPAAAAPAAGAATALCKDGTSYTGESKKGACSGHKGIKEWYGAKGAPAAAAAAAAAPAKAAPAQPAVAAGGGAGKVWVNSATKTYHCSGSKWYGKTKAGEYMSEADAKAKGNHADHGKACS